MLRMLPELLPLAAAVSNGMRFTAALVDHALMSAHYIPCE